MTNEQAAALQYPFTANEIEWRVLHTTKDKSKGQVAAYVDSRAIQDRLDAVLGRENWQNRFCTVQGKDNASTTQVSITRTAGNGSPRATGPAIPILSPSKAAFPTPSSARPLCGASAGTCTI